jgi:hypothetical protein
MSKKVISLAALWLLLSTLVQAQGQPPTGPTGGAAPAEWKRNVELVSTWPSYPRFCDVDALHVKHYDATYKTRDAFVGCMLYGTDVGGDYTGELYKLTFLTPPARR